MTVEPFLQQSSVFRFFPLEHQERVRALFRKVQYDFGESIVRQGDPADAFYVLLSGRARVIKTTARGEEIVLNTLRPGSEFGEAALLSPAPRTATVRCSSIVEALRLGRDDFATLINEFPELRGHLEVTQRYRTLQSFLYEFSNFGRLPQPAINELVHRLTAEKFKAGQRIIDKGDPAGPMYVVQSGKVRAFDPRSNGSKALAFYRDVIGFAVQANIGSAAFVSAGGYHHHLAVNVWNGEGVGPAPAHTVGLRRWTIELPGAADVDAVRARLRAAGVPAIDDEHGVTVDDPWGITARISSPPA